MINKILISACLMGFKVRYNGSDKAKVTDKLSQWQQEKRLVVHCPELAAGLTIPRPPAEIMSGDGNEVMRGRARIIENSGRDVTEHYQLAAWLALRAAQESGCRAALLTDGSPTCGSRNIYDGSFNNIRKSGMGVAASLLASNGIVVFSEEQLSELILWVEEREGNLTSG